MALNFPNSPTLNQVYTDSISGFSYQWNGTVWISFSAASSSQIKTLDDISSGFNNSTQTFALTTNTIPIVPLNAQSLIINLGGVIQDPSDDYSVSGSNIVFSTAPTNGLSFSGISLGPAIPIDYANNGNVYTRNIYTATASQTVFTITGTYTVGYIEVYQNGVRLTEGTDFTATSGTTFVLTTPANLNDEVVSVAYKVASLVTTTGQFDNLIISGVSTFVGFATHTGTIFGNNLSLTGVATATSFSGNASSASYATNAGYSTSSGISTNLKGGVVGNIPYQSATDTTAFLTNGGSGTVLQSNGVGNAPSWVTAAPAGAITGLTIRDEGNIVGDANSFAQLNFVGSIVSVASSSGIATITFLDYVSNAGVSTSVIGGIGSITQLNVSGISTLGITSATNLTSQQLNVSGISTLGIN